MALRVDTPGFGIAVDDAQAGAVFGLAVRHRLFAGSHLLRYLHGGSRDRIGVWCNIAAATCGQEGEEGGSQDGAEYGSFHNADRKEFVGNGPIVVRNFPNRNFFRSCQ